jgi:hypothetical protein
LLSIQLTKPLFQSDHITTHTNLALKRLSQKAVSMLSINLETPTLQYKTINGDGGVILGTKGEDTKESLMVLLINKYGKRLDVETTKKLNGMVQQS